MKASLIAFLPIFISSIAYADISDKFIYDRIDKGMVYNCFTSTDMKLQIAVDRARNRISHAPFSAYNKIKLIKSEKEDDVNPLFTDTYIELHGRKKIGTFTITFQGNDVWEASYKIPRSNTSIKLNTSNYDIGTLNAICYK